MGKERSPVRSGPRRRYSGEFKLEAVRLLEQAQKPATDLAIELGVRRNQLYKWQRELRGKRDRAFRGPGRKPIREQTEVERLRAELKRVTEERDILKKAEAYFTKKPK